MRKIARLALASVLFAAGCPGDDENVPPTAIDAATDAATVDMAMCVDCDGGLTDGPTPIDATPFDAPIDAMSSVTIVQCPGNPDLEISAATGAYVYVPTPPVISVNGVVRFIPGAVNHNMTSGTSPNPDGLFATPDGQTVCLRFSAAGTFPFYCSVHGFSGSLTVQ